MSATFRGVVGVLCLIAVGLSTGCATPGEQDEWEGDRRATVLEDDNDALRKQLTDLGAVETALNRELASQKQELEQARSRAAELESRNQQLEDENRRLAGELETAARPVASHGEALDVSGLKGRDIEVVNDGGQVQVRLAGAVMFAPGRDELTDEGKRILDRLGNVLNQRKDVFISVEGHTDAMPLGSTKEVWGTNLALSLARAMSVHDFLKRSKAIPEDRMRVVGWGEHKPIVPGKTPEANARNRRVELILSHRES